MQRFALVALLSAGVCVGQDLEPRRWTHLPVGSNIASLNYGRTDADIFFSPALQLENVEMEMHTVVAAYTRSFAFLGTTARLDTIVPYSSARWKGLLSGSPASTRRDGFADP